MPATITPPAIGDIVVAGVGPATPNGVLGHVDDVRTTGSTTSVTTSPASLTDALPAGGRLRDRPT
jgi:hypothetical protein